ncbi:hypothetical protein HY949_00515 [Candidatus Gottesmanbacteria bacterium]|nr:hypothetical protein [Candidatus Gottesmanbacteria bacterium]
MNKRKRVTRGVSRAALGLTEGLFSHAVDLSLWLMVYFGELSIPFGTYGKSWRAAAAADRFLGEVNYEVIKQAISNARRYGYLTKTTGRTSWPKITAAGRRRLASIIPRYDEERVWDGKIHLVTYDIPEERADDRYLLREYIKRIGCGRLQDSVWITVYNPIDLIRMFARKHDLEGTIIVSDVGKDGSVGDEDVRALVSRVYQLELLNDRYDAWLHEIEDNGVDHWAMIRYLSILKDDPQLPFLLLPPTWKGDRAYQRIKSNLQPYMRSM